MIKCFLKITQINIIGSATCHCQHSEQTNTPLWPLNFHRQMRNDQKGEYSKQLLISHLRQPTHKYSGAGQQFPTLSFINAQHRVCYNFINHDTYQTWMLVWTSTRHGYQSGLQSIIKNFNHHQRSGPGVESMASTALLQFLKSRICVLCKIPPLASFVAPPTIACMLRKS